MARRRKPKQLVLELNTWGGAREGAGCKPAGDSADGSTLRSTGSTTRRTGSVLVLLPAAEPTHEGRTAIAAPFVRWQQHTHTVQMWRMFAPDGPRSVSSIDVELTRVDGETIALGTGLPDTDLARDKREKVVRRLATGEGQGTWYRKWHGRYICRWWATTYGELPEEVTIWLVTRPIAAPEIYVHGDPRDVEIEERKIVWQQRCRNEAHAQPPSSPDFVPWIKRRAPAWAELRAKGEVPDLPWPFAILLAPAIVLALPQRKPNQDRGTA